MHYILASIPWPIALCCLLLISSLGVWRFWVPSNRFYFSIIALLCSSPQYCLLFELQHPGGGLACALPGLTPCRAVGGQEQVRAVYRTGDAVSNSFSVILSGLPGTCTKDTENQLRGKTWDKVLGFPMIFTSWADLRFSWDWPAWAQAQQINYALLLVQAQEIHFLESPFCTVACQPF